MASKPPASTGAPAGVPPSGNGKFVAIAVILLGAIGGAIAWQKCKTPPAPPVVVVDAGPPPKPSGRNPDDDIPLPPPVEDAGPKDAGGKVTTAFKVDNQCGVKTCTGGASPELEAALAMRTKSARKPCYDRALEQDQTLKGKVVVSVRVGATGQVCSASVASNTLSNPAVATCAASLFQGMNFPAPRGGCADVNIPINFVPR